MCNLAKFSTTTTQWLLEEQKNDLLQLGNSAIVRTVLGLTGMDDVLSYKESSFNLLDASKKIVMQEMSSEDGLEQSIACMNRRQRELAQEGIGWVAEAELLIIKLEETCNASPKFDPDKAAIADTIEGLRRVYAMAQVNPVTPAGEALQELVDSGLISQDSLDRYLQDANIAPAGPLDSTSQVVNELRDRYYTIDRGTPIPYGEIPENNFRIVGEDGEVVNSVSGMEPGELLPDGTIVIPGPMDGVAQNAVRSLKIEAEAKRLRPSMKAPTFAMKTGQNRQAVEESLSHEIWACLLLDIVEALSNTWERLKIAIDGLVNVLLSQNALAKMTPLQSAIGRIPSNAMGSIYKIDALLKEVISIGDLSTDFLGVQDSLKRPGLPGTHSGGKVCDFNHQKYCDVHRNLLEFTSNIEQELDLINFSFGGRTPDDLNFDFPTMVEMLSKVILPLRDKVDEGDDLLNKLKGDACAFIAKRMRGTPKSLGYLKNFLSGVSDWLAEITPLAIDIEISDKIINVANTLIKVGYVAGAAMLLAGDFLGFILLKEGDATMSGQVAACLQEAAGKCPNPSNRARMLELSRAAMARSQQKTTGQKIREGIRRRVNIATPYLSSQAIVSESMALAKECVGGGP